MEQKLSKSYEYLDLLSKKLDDRQKKVCCRTGNTVVAAGAGSGKTQVLATRFAWLVMSCNVPASKILTLTFTKKAAGEMYDRIYQTLSFFAQNPQTPPVEKDRAAKALEVFGETHIQTLDSYCSNIVRQAANRYGIRPDFSAGSSDTDRQIKDDALPFIIKHRNNPAVLAFANAGRLQEFAEDVFASTVNKYASIADSDTFFTDKLTFQCQKVAMDFNYFVFGRGHAPKEIEEAQNLNELENQILYELDQSDVQNEFTQKVHNLLGIIDSIQNNFEQITDEYVANSNNPAMQKLLNLCDSLVQASQINLQKGVVKSVSPYIKILRDQIVPKISSLCAYIRQFNTIKQLFTLLNEFHVRVKKSKKISGNLSFRDIQKMALLILKEQPDLRAQENAAYDKIMIDEFQDNNGENRELLFLLCSPAESGINPTASQIAGEKLFFVGDEKQSIYKFRGADVSVFNELQNDFKTNFGEESVLPMEYNYRSDNPLITSFNKLFGGDNGIFNKKITAAYEAQYSTETKKYNPAKKEVVAPEILTAENVKMHFCLLNKQLLLDNDKLPVSQKLDLPDEKEQNAWFIANKINELCKNGTPYNKIAILDRSRTNRNMLIKWLNIFGIPYSLDQNSNLFSSGLIYDIYNFLRTCVYPSDNKTYAAYLCSPFAGLSWNSVETILACKINAEVLQKLLTPDEFVLYQQAQDFLEKTQPLVLSQPLTKTLEILWNATGYRYETFLNRRTQLSAEQFDLLYELARQCDSNGKGVAWFVDQLSILNNSESSSLSDDVDLDAKDLVYPVEKEDAVQILTIHKSKGLQYDHVFVCGCFAPRKKSESSAVFYDEEFGLSVRPEKDSGNYFFDLQKSLAERKELAEFRRLIYVAITRAIKDVYVVGAASKTKSSNPVEDEKSLKLLEKQLDFYYPDWGDVNFALEHPEFIENAPFDYLSVKPVCRDVINQIKNQKKELSPEQMRKNLSQKILQSYQNAAVIQVEPEPDSRITPSSLEDSAKAQVLTLEVQDKYEAVNKIIKKHCKNADDSTKENTFTSDDPDSAAKNDYDGMIDSSEFRFKDFGTLVHLYAQTFANGIEPENFLPDSKLFKTLEPEEIPVITCACCQMVKAFSKSSTGTDLICAKEEGRFVKAEYAFRTLSTDNQMLVTGSIDLIFQNKDGTYTIVDYKTDRKIAPGIYYGQQSCYRLAASRLLNCPQEKIRCYLYYTRFDKTIEITDKL